jgi:hypothetical protein
MTSALENERRIAVGAWTLPADKRDEHRKAFGYTGAVLLLSLCINVETVTLGDLRVDDVLDDYFKRSNYRFDT